MQELGKNLFSEFLEKKHIILIIFLNFKFRVNKSGIFPKGILDENNNIIESLATSLVVDGEVTVEGEERAFADILDMPYGEEEEEKKEPLQLLKDITAQEYFFINTKRTYKVGIAAIEIKRWEKLSNRLFTSFSLSSQALGVSTDAFNELAITQGLGNKQALIVKNSILAMVDKSAALGKKPNVDEQIRIREMFYLLLNFIQFSQSIALQLRNELNNGLSLLFTDKKSDSVQQYIERSEGSLRQSLTTFTEILHSIITNKIQTLGLLGDKTEENTKNLKNI